MIVLGIESSCDETAASVVRDGNELLSNVVFSSMDLHKAFGGVVPEIAARSHIESIIPVIDEAVAVVGWDAIDAIAVTYGAGLGGSLLVGVTTARTLAVTKNKPLYGINHVEGHVYANFLTKTALTSYQLPATAPEFPLLALIVSGGHSQLALFRDHFDYTLLGQTRDDAIGEAFDKVAKITGLPYPGGPSIAKAAELGDPHAYQFPKARLEPSQKILDLRRKIFGKDSRISHLKSNVSYDFSFSGLKTAVLRLAQEIIGENYTFPSYQLPERLSDAQKYDIAASFQRIAIETVVDKTILAYEEFQPKSVVIAGGVAANQELRRQLAERLHAISTKSQTPNNKQIQNSKSKNTATDSSPVSNLQSPILHITDPKLCTDNGAMIATLGCFKAMLGQSPVDPATLQIEPNLSM